MLRFVVFGVMGLLLAGVGTIAYIGLQPPPEVAAAPHRQVAILVAAGALRAGALLQPADLATRQVDATAQPAGAHPDNADERRLLTGGMVRRSLSEAEPILSDDVLRPGDRGFLAAVLAPGSRAVSVAVDAVSGTAGLIWPGDRVDVILTQTLDQPDLGPGRRVAGETVLDDARVIAVDQQLVQGGQAGGLLDQHGAPSSRTITLEVDPRDAARIAVATRLGKLQVVLRAAQPAAQPGAGLPAPQRRTVTAASDRGFPSRLIATAGAATLPRPPATVPALVPALVPGTGPGTVPGLATPAAAPEALGPPVWGGDVSQALGDGAAPQRNLEVRLYQGTRKAEAYHF